MVVGWVAAGAVVVWVVGARSSCIEGASVVGVASGMVWVAFVGAVWVTSAVAVVAFVVTAGVFASVFSLAVAVCCSMVWAAAGWIVVD